MAKRSFSFATYTPVAVADTAAFTANTYLALNGGSSTQQLTILEVYMGGQAGASSPSIMLFARDSTVVATPTTLAGGATDAAMDPATAALAAPANSAVTGSTQAQRSSTLHLLNLSFNAFGGIVRWVAAPGEEPKTLGNTASLGEVSLNAFTGGTPGLMGSHIVYEPS